MDIEIHFVYGFLILSILLFIFSKHSFWVYATIVGLSYLHYPKKQENISKPICNCEVLKVKKSNQFYQTFALCTQETRRFKALITWRSHQPKTSEVYQIEAPINELKENILPNEFSYKNYLQKQNINHRISVWNPSQFKLIYAQNKWEIWRHNLHQKINKNWSRTLNKEELATLRAICFGDKSEMDKEKIGQFQQAGIMHLIAVSGLHVGVIYQSLFWILTYIFGKNHSRVWIKQTICLALLLFYGWICYFPASIGRSIFMFAFIFISYYSIRPIWNKYILFLSGFIWLILYPNQLWDLGFQFSYLATYGILLGGPILAKLSKSIKNKFLKYSFQLIGISIVAQIFLSPLLFYYFHQIPTWFLLFQIPAFVLIIYNLYAGLLSIILMFFTEASELILQTSKFSILILDGLLHSTKLLPIPFIKFPLGSLISVLSLACILLFLGRFIFQKRKGLFFAVLSTLLLVASESMIKYSKKTDKSKYFHKSNSSFGIITQNNNELFYLTETRSLSTKDSLKLSNYANYQNKKITILELPSSTDGNRSYVTSPLEANANNWVLFNYLDKFGLEDLNNINASTKNIWYISSYKEHRNSAKKLPYGITLIPDSVNWIYMH
jgi:competence protein ComEC